MERDQAANNAQECCTAMNDTLRIEMYYHAWNFKQKAHSGFNDCPQCYFFSSFASFSPFL